MPWSTVGAQCRAAVPHRRAGRRRPSATASRRRCARSVSPGSREPIRASCRAACGCASRSPARWSPSPICCCSTSRSRRSTRSPGIALNDDLLRLWEAHRPTILFVTHSVFESVYLSTRIAVMRARPGRIVADLPVALPRPRRRAVRTEPGICRDVRRRVSARARRARCHARRGTLPRCRPHGPIASAARTDRRADRDRPRRPRAVGSRRADQRHPALCPAGPERDRGRACGPTGRACLARCS